MANKWIYRLRSLLLLWGTLFFGLTLILLFQSETLFNVLNGLTQNLQLPLSPVSEPGEDFWRAVTFCWMAMLMYVCFYASMDLKRRVPYVAMLLFAKFVSTLVFLFYFIFKTQSFAYLLSALLDASIFVITYAVYLRVRREYRLMGMA